LHVYGSGLLVVSGLERDQLIGRIEHVLAGSAPPTPDLAVAEFGNDLHHVMLVVRESC